MVLEAYAGARPSSYGISMKCEVRKVYTGAVSCTEEVTILLQDPKESEALRQALAVVQKYRDAATKATGTRVYGENPNCD